MRHDRNPLELILPFGLVGAYGAWVWARLMVGPLLRATPRGVPQIAAEAGAIGGLGCGLVVLVLVRRRFDHDSLGMAVGWTLPLAGAAAGTATHLLSGAHLLIGSILFGVVGAFLLIPLCLAIGKAALRAGRARNGSLVAAADGRSIWTTTSMVLTAACLFELYQWSRCDDPWHQLASDAALAARVAIAVATITVLTTAVVHLADARASRRADALAEHLEHVAPEPAQLVEGSAGFTDLGLGDDRRIERSDGGSAYRHGTQPIGEIVGDPTLAANSLSLLARKSRFALGAAAATLALHLIGYAVTAP